MTAACDDSISSEGLVICQICKALNYDPMINVKMLCKIQNLCDRSLKLHIW